MPTAIVSAVSAFIVSAGAAAGVAVAAGTATFLANVLVYAGLSLGSFFLQQALQQKPSQPTPEDVQQSVKQGIQPRIRHYGRVKTSGPWLFAGTKTGDFHKVIALAHGEIDAVEELWIDDNQVTVNGSDLVTAAPYNSKLLIQFTTGQASETAFSGLVSTFTGYTSNHKGNGIALLYAKQFAVPDTDYYETFPNGVNSIYSVVMRGAKVTSIDTDTEIWSDNAADVIKDYMTHADGMRLPASIFETTQAAAGWQTAWDICDEDVDLDAGGTEKRYRLWGSYSLQENPGDVVARMLANCDGRLMPTSDGGVTLVVNTWAEPSITMDEGDILDVVELTQGLDSEQRPNTIRASYLEPDAGYQTADADPWADDADVTARGIEVDDISLIMSPSHTQARRLMKRRFYRRNPDWVGRFTFNKKGLALVGETRVRISIAAFGINDVFEINDLEFNIGEGGIIEGVTADLATMPEAAFTWDESTEEGTKPEVTGVSEDSTIPVPSNFDVTIQGGAAPYAVLEFDAPTADSLRTEAQYRDTDDTEWIPIPIQQGATETQSPTLIDGEEYEFQVRHRSSTGRAGEWTSSVTKTVTADATAPGVPTGVSGSTGSSAGEADLAWTNPNSANFSRVVIKRHTADVEGSATEISDSPIYGAPSAAGSLTETGLAADDYYYWIYAANGSGVESAGVATGAVTVT